jgi:hypothetical protein
VELKSLEEVKSYLLHEGTCKCGIECPIVVETAFDFDVQVRLENRKNRKPENR